MTETDAETQPSERHASWLELFFDLVVVVAVAQVSHRLHEPSWTEVGISLLLFAAIWICWMSFTLYANVRADATRTRSILAAMAGIAVMAAAAQEADGERAVTFAVAYLAVRILATQTWRRTGSMLLDWPAAQAGAGVAPWIASIWVDGPWRYGLWALGLAIDVVIPIFLNRSTAGAENLLKERQQEFTRRREERDARRHRDGKRSRDDQRGRRGRDSRAPELTIVHIDADHFVERLGLFTIIVLGESVYRLVSAAADEVEWNAELIAVAGGGFVIVVGLWWLTFRYGFSAAPHARLSDVAPRFALPVHMIMTAGLMIAAAGLGSFAEHPDGDAPQATGWLLGGGLAGYFVAMLAVAVLERAPARWLLGWGVPSVVVATGLAVTASSIPVVVTVWALVLVVAWQVTYAQWRT